MARRLWVDAYRPTSLDELDYHPPLTELLRRLARSEDLPHLLFYGPSGSGKKTRVLALLHCIFGPGVSKVKTETRNFKSSSHTFELHVLQSNYHIDMTPSDVAFKDKIIIQDIIKEIGSNRNPDGKAFRVVILNQADNLTTEAQAALRRTMEKYTSTTRIIMICNSLCRVIAPLRSRCLAIRVPAPTRDDMSSVLRKIVGSEKVALPSDLEDEVCAVAKGNLRKAIMMLQTLNIQYGRLDSRTEVPLPEWQKYIKEVAKNVISEQTPKCLKLIRTKLFDLLASCIPPSSIMFYLCDELLEMINPDIKTAVIKHASEYEIMMKHGSKPVVHLEAFIAKTMFLIKQNMNAMQFG